MAAVWGLAGCGDNSGTLLPPLSEHAVRSRVEHVLDSKPRPTFPVFWTGPRAAGFPLAHDWDPGDEYRRGGTDGVTFYYGELCLPDNRVDAGTCNFLVEVSSYPLCEYFQQSIDRPVRHVRIDRLPGIITAQSAALRLYTSQTTIEIKAGPIARAIHAARQLRELRVDGKTTRPKPYRRRVLQDRPSSCG